MVKDSDRNLLDDAAMSFDDIGKALGITRGAVHSIYRSALRKIQKDGPAMDVLVDWASYHHHLRARSAECLAAREHW